jgi:hypothetical protein
MKIIELIVPFTSQLIYKTNFTSHFPRLLADTNNALPYQMLEKQKT